MTTTELVAAQAEMKLRNTPPPRAEMGTLTLDETRRLLKAARTAGLREHAMVALLLSWGMRVSELVAIKRSDVCLLANYSPSIRIERLKKKQTHVDVLALRPSVARIVKRYLLSRTDDDSRLFPVTRVQLWRQFRRLCEQANVRLEVAHPHSCRHTLASRMVEMNVSLPVVQRALGHASITSTMKYVTVRQEQANDAVHAAVKRMFQ